MSDITFRHPEAIWAVAAAVVSLVAWHFLRRPAFSAISADSLLRGRGFRASAVRRFPVALCFCGLCLVLLALADPVIPYSEESVQSRGVDIAIVLDLSSSMEEVMGTPGVGVQRTRLDVTKRAIADFIARRPGDRIGMVVFSDFAYVVSPLTVDHDYLQRYVAMIDNQILRSEGMTAIGEGVTVANALLTRQAVPGARRDRVIVIFTDGENNYGRDPMEALNDSRSAGYRVHMIGVDLEAEIKAKPEVVRLVRTVQQRGGRYFTADTAGQLTSAAHAIDALEPGILVTSRSTRNVPAFQWLAASAIVTLGAALLLRSVPFFVDLT